MELTQEYFDKKLESLATKEDLQKFATKEDLQAQTAELKAFAVEQTEELARIIATTVAVPLETHLQTAQTEPNARAEITTLKQDVRTIKQALHLSA